MISIDDFTSYWKINHDMYFGILFGKSIMVHNNKIII